MIDSKGFGGRRNVSRQIRRWKRSVADLLPSKRGRAIAEARAWVAEAAERVTAVLQTERKGSGTAADEASRREAAERADGMRGFARMLMPFDVAAQWVLAIAAFPQFGTWPNLLIAVAITGGVWYATLRAFRMWHDPDRPARSIRVARWVAGIASIIAALGGAVYATARFALPQYFANLEGLLFACLVALAEIGPIASGAASFGSWVADKPARTAARIATLERELGELTAFGGWLDENGDNHPPSGDAVVASPHLVPESAELGHA